jgi:hypothetical protein
MPPLKRILLVEDSERDFDLTREDSQPALQSGMALSRNYSVRRKARPHPGPLPQGEGVIFARRWTTHHYLVSVSQSGKERFPLLGERVRVRAIHIFNE